MDEPKEIVSCACGAGYERVTVDLPIRDIGLFECHACGKVLESWSGRRVPMFKPLAAPHDDRDVA